MRLTGARLASAIGGKRRAAASELGILLREYAAMCNRQRVAKSRPRTNAPVQAARKLRRSCADPKTRWPRRKQGQAFLRKWGSIVHKSFEKSPLHETAFSPGKCAGAARLRTSFVHYIRLAKNGPRNCQPPKATSTLAWRTVSLHFVPRRAHSPPRFGGFVASVLRTSSPMPTIHPDNEPRVHQAKSPRFGKS